MNLNDIKPPLTGDDLITALKTARGKREYIADGFLYQQTILMIAAEPGIGKSTISTQVALELSAGMPVFGVFACKRPMKVLYIQTERGVIEFLERAETMNKCLPLVKENLYVTDDYQKLDLLKPDQASIMINSIKYHCPDVDVIFADPIYAMVGGGLKDDIPASAFTRAMSRLQKETGATLWYNHHTTKPSYDGKGNVIMKDDPFYGSQWLKAHVTGSFHMISDNGGVKLVKKKDNYKLLPSTISLEYDPESELCSIPLDELPAIERVKNFIRARELDNKEFYFKDIEHQTKLCTRTLRSLLLHSSIRDRLIVVSSIKNKKLYKISTV